MMVIFFVHLLFDEKFKLLDEYMTKNDFNFSQQLLFVILTRKKKDVKIIIEHIVFEQIAFVTLSLMLL